MKPIELLRRAAGKSPGYVLRRGFLEIGRQLRSRRLRARLRSLTASSLARELECGSLFEFWRSHGPANQLFPRSDREKIRSVLLERYPEECRCLDARVEKILAHEFDLLGSGPTLLGKNIDWHRDFTSGTQWPLDPSGGIDYADLGQPSDVKVPWELSRGQHLTTLGRAWVVRRDDRCWREFEAQVRSWIRANPVGLGVNWACTMDVALRAVSWLWALALFDDAPLSDEFREEILLSLYQHGLWIPSHLEVGEINGNHFLSDVLGLIACGTPFRGTPEGARWLDLGARLLEREIREQVENDGVDIEASVPYHRLVLELFLVGARLLEVAGRPVSADYRTKLSAMIDFVHAYVTPEGLSPVIGDADDGRALILGETDVRDHRYLLSTGAALFGRADWKHRAGKFWEDSLWLLGPEARAHFEELVPRSEETSHGFPDSGFYVLRSPAQYLFADVGPVGFRGRGGHGHNDCLSFEWHARGRPVLTDSGTYVYTASPEWRNRFRSTEFHNTIRVDGEEINRIPSPLSLWTLHDDAVPSGVSFVQGTEEEVLEASHTGYRRLADPVTVSRRFRFERGRARVLLTDSFLGRARHRIEVFFHVAPGGSGTLEDADRCLIIRFGDDRTVAIRRTSHVPLAWRRVAGWFSPSYGVKIERESWAAFVDADLPLEITWELTART